jgi:dCMP deaminase
MQRAIQGMGIFDTVSILDAAQVEQIVREGASITMPEEEISHVLAQTYFAPNPVTYASVFLRWDKPITLQELEVPEGQVVSTDALDATFMRVAEQEQYKSADWWRQIGAAAVREGTVLFVGHNQYLPSDYNLFAAGNPRDNFDAGEHPEIYTAIHAEAHMVARAAREGTSLAGASVYVTTFPCANCARLLAEAGVSKVYYRDGYSRLDALDVLKAYHIEIVLVRD